MPELEPASIPLMYASFHAPITELDCGKKCAPYNERGVPFCCDTRHALPTAYHSEWLYLKSQTDLWHEWQAPTPKEALRIESTAPAEQVLLECQGFTFCQRQFRTLTCRAFPFYPYVTLRGEFLGLSYYWEYENRCWVISNLSKVTLKYRQEFINLFETILEQTPLEKANFRYHSIMMRRIFGRQRRAIPLLHRNGNTYKISPRNGRMRRIKVEDLPAFSPYNLEHTLPFPEEVS